MTEVAEEKISREELEEMLAEEIENTRTLWDDTQELTWQELAEDFPSLVRDTVTGPRQEQYGPPEQMLTLIAHFWTPLFGVPMNAQTVAVALMLLKVARLIGGNGSPDTVLDTAGYAWLIAKVQALATAPPKDD